MKKKNCNSFNENRMSGLFFIFLVPAVMTGVIIGRISNVYDWLVIVLNSSGAVVERYSLQASRISLTYNTISRRSSEIVEA